MSKSRFMKKFLAILVFGFVSFNICVSAMKKTSSSSSSSLKPRLKVTGKGVKSKPDSKPKSKPNSSSKPKLKVTGKRVKPKPDPNPKPNSQLKLSLSGNSVQYTKEPSEPSKQLLEMEDFQKKMEESNQRSLEISKQTQQLGEQREKLEKEKLDFQKKMKESNKQLSGMDKQMRQLEDQRAKLQLSKIEAFRTEGLEEKFRISMEEPVPQPSEMKAPDSVKLEAISIKNTYKFMPIIINTFDNSSSGNRIFDEIKGKITTGAVLVESAKSTNGTSLFDVYKTEYDKKKLFFVLIENPANFSANDKNGRGLMNYGFFNKVAFIYDNFFEFLSFYCFHSAKGFTEFEKICEDCQDEEKEINKTLHYTSRKLYFKPASYFVGIGTQHILPFLNYDSAFSASAWHILFFRLNGIWGVDLTKGNTTAEFPCREINVFNNLYQRGNLIEFMLKRAKDAGIEGV
ncbi:MAG: hypothetical protein CfP315_0576 [Candidatus Improbicoccus pseudotrichonymphae]|uniref:Uncharacterized protein n=1 Tax=Candidatus Improbicoccus pseudotrichonymphae TaxID=3033792 RepID=A0AA48KX43_9FIRM|nr:MAG: hypothetical protein CfP315_0576 [Candidatus Improbicoccus pseudotrichonymphae]